MKYYLCVSFLILIACPSYTQIPAFPGAEGYGTHTKGGRGGRIIKVTNLNDSGPGSFRDAIEAKGARIVVFTVGGTIDLETEISLSNPFITIAGQTAPGGGICIRGETLRIRSHDIIIRHIRFRPGDIDFGPTNEWDKIDALSISNGYNIVIDHCSLSWAVDENMDIWNQSHDITIQNCIIAEALNKNQHPNGAHSMGLLIGSDATNISLHHNIFAHNNDRNPHVNGKSVVDIRNNIIYNPGGIATDIRSNQNQAINYVNNYIIKGPDTRIPGDIFIRNLKNHQPKIFISGNIGIGNVFKEVYSLDDSKGTIVRDKTFLARFRLENEIPSPKVKTLSALDAIEFVLNNAGALLPRRDPVDRKIVDDILKKKGKIIHSKGSHLAWPPLDSGLPFTDDDNDGMPNHWEDQYGLKKHLDDSSDDPDEDGYTNIEGFINKTDPQTNTSLTPLGFSVNNKAQFVNNLKFNLEKSYPNPVSDYANITFTIKNSSNVKLGIIDAVGREVVSLINSFLYEGEYNIIWDINNIEPGPYLIVLTSVDGILGHRIMVSY